MIETAFDNREELNTVVERLLEEKLVCSCQVVESDSKRIGRINMSLVENILYL